MCVRWAARRGRAYSCFSLFACFSPFSHLPARTPDAHGARSKPAYWARVPVKLLDKKVPSPCISKKRDIGLPSQLLKIQAGLYLPAYAAIMGRLPGNFGWTPGVAARGAALCGSLVLDHTHLLSHFLLAIYADIQRFFPSMDRGWSRLCH